MQLVELDIAKEVKRICDKYNINYFLSYGTLLGAIRHNGFIPWDDDIDIGILRSEYEKFLKIANKELKSQYILVTWFNDEKYYLPFAKIMKKGTIALEPGNSKKNGRVGIYIDIFPYDNFLMNNRMIRKFIYKLISRMIFVKCDHYPWLEVEKSNFKKYVQYIPIRVLSFLFSKDFLKKKCEEMIKKYNNFDSEFMYSAECPYRVIFKKIWLTDVIDASFENIIFKIPKYYDHYLEKVYGEYMKLPPKNDRKGHNFIKIKF
ncbi:MAG: LicD family protein [Streptococcaceae bacterium]|nr:LicD family protein [Streptococcaceae bacterium]